MLKAHGVPVGRRVVVAGTGAFLWPVAAGLITAGVEVAAIVEASPLIRNVRSSAALLRHRSIAAQAAGYLRTVARARVPLLSGQAVVAAHGSGRVESVTVARLDGAGRREIEVDSACVGWGFVPSVELARSLGCAEVAHPDRPYTTVVVDDEQATSVRSVFAAGELTGIGGAVVAAAEGEIAGAAAAVRLGRSSTSSQYESVVRARRTLRRARQAAAVLDAAYPIPRRWTQWLDADTLMCRCEEVGWPRGRRGRRRRGGHRAGRQGTDPLRHGLVPGTDVRPGSAVGDLAAVRPGAAGHRGSVRTAVRDAAHGRRACRTRRHAPRQDLGRRIRGP